MHNLQEEDNNELLGAVGGAAPGGHIMQRLQWDVSHYSPFPLLQSLLSQKNTLINCTISHKAFIAEQFNMGPWPILTTFSCFPPHHHTSITRLKENQSQQVYVTDQYFRNRANQPVHTLFYK